MPEPHDVDARRRPGGGAGPRPGAPAPLRHAGLLAALASVLTAPAAQAQSTQADIRVTGQRPGASCAPLDYACLNAALQAAARAGQPAPSAADAAARAATVPSKAGTFSFAATAQRMGRNLGHAAQPYRPPTPAYSHPVRGARPR